MKNKKLLTFLLVGILVLVAGTNCVFAVEPKGSAEILPMPIGTVATTQEEVDEMMARDNWEFVKPFFEAPTSYEVIDLNGNDISEQCYFENIALFEEGDYLQVYYNMRDKVSSIDKKCGFLENSKVLGMRKPILKASKNRSAYNAFCCLYTPAITHSEATVGMTGNFTVDTVNGIITKASNPFVELESYQHTDWHRVILSSLSRTYSIAKNKSTVEYRASFYLYSDDGNNVTKVGKYALSMKSDSNGNVISVSPEGYVYPIR